MIKQFKYKSIVWIDVKSPTKEEIASLSNQYDLHPVAANELLSPTRRSKVDVYDDFIYLVLHFPDHYQSGGAQADSDGSKDTHEVDFILGKDFIITATYETVEPMDEFAKIFEANSALDKSKREIHAGYLFYYIVRHLYQSTQANLDSINGSLDSVENDIFSGHEKKMVTVLSGINRQLFDFRRAIKPHREVLESLQLAGTDFFGPKFVYYLKAISGECGRVWNLLEESSATFDELRGTNESLLTIKTNETIKALTFIAIFALPVTMIGQIFGMSLDSIPLRNDPLGFMVIVGLMIIAVLLTYGYFRMKKWL